jgi:hypothetical protein
MKIRIAVVLLTISLPVAADTSADIAAEEARISALRKEIEPLVMALQATKADIRVFVSLEPIIGAVAGLNSLPPAQRTVSFQSTGANGHFWENNDLCNSYVELQGPGDLHASGQLTSFNAAQQDDGSLSLSAHADTSGHLQAHWHFFGVRARGPFGWNVCPPGGGFGGSIGADFQKGLDFKVNIQFAMSSDGQALSYQASIAEPRRVDVTISFGLEHLGNVGFPTSFDVPGGAIGSRQFPLLIANGGRFTIPGDKQAREYVLTLKPDSFSSTRAGVTAQWMSDIAITQRVSASR